jgi:hypothetical protein
VNGDDIRPEPSRTASAGSSDWSDARIALNETYREEIFKHAVALGCEGIVSKRLGSPYRAGRSAHWLKIKNPEAPAVGRAKAGGGRLGGGAAVRGQRFRVPYEGLKYPHMITDARVTRSWPRNISVEAGRQNTNLSTFKSQNRWRN